MIHFLRIQVARQRPRSVPVGHRAQGLEGDSPHRGNPRVYCEGQPTQTKLVNTVARLAFEWNVFGNIKPLTMSRWRGKRRSLKHLLPVALP